jgi:hypothetical protein
MTRVPKAHKRRTHGVAEPSAALACCLPCMGTCNAISESHELNSVAGDDRNGVLKELWYGWLHQRCQ